MGGATQTLAALAVFAVHTCSPCSASLPQSRESHKFLMRSVMQHGTRWTVEHESDTTQSSLTSRPWPSALERHSKRTTDFPVVMLRHQAFPIEERERSRSPRREMDENHSVHDEDQPAIAVRADRQVHDGHVPRMAVRVRQQMRDAGKSAVVGPRTTRRGRSANRSSGRAASTSGLQSGRVAGRRRTRPTATVS